MILEPAAYTVAFAALFLCITIGNSSQAQPGKHSSSTMHASGTFQVKLTPQKLENPGDSTRARTSIDKQFHGDIEGTSKGEMLTAATSVKDSAGYVAIERITGTLKGRNGSFTLQHSATMDRGKPSLSITVVPDSGTGDLTGLTGTMDIKITNGKHFYEFDYSLPDKR
jgi:hypothetical protein